MATNDMPLEQQLKYLEVLANESLCLWDLPDNARARLINVSENATYLVEAAIARRSCASTGKTTIRVAPSNASWRGRMRSTAKAGS